MPDILGYDEAGNPIYSELTTEDKMKGIRVKSRNELIDPLPKEKNQVLPTDFAGMGETHLAENLFGLNGKERYQTWPEKMIRSAVTLPHDVVTGALPVTNEAGNTSDELIQRAQDMAGLAGTAPLAMKPGTASVGSGMVRKMTSENGLKLTPVEQNPFDKHTDLNKHNEWLSNGK